MGGVSLFTELSACAEKLLLVLCARTEVRAEIQEQIREILRRRLDWDYLLDEATENSVLPLFERQIKTIAPTSLPGEAHEKLKSACRANTVRCLFLSAELVKVLEAFRGQGVRAIAYKGPTLAVQAYGDVALRDFDDLDIVVQQKDMARADEVMRGLRYRPKLDWVLSEGTSEWMAPGEYKYVDEARRAIVELHTEVSLRHFRVRPKMEELAERAVAVTVAGREVATFSVEDGLSMLCVHGAKDFWERIGWVADVAEMLKSHPGVDWEKARRSAESLGAGRMLDLGLVLAADTLDAPVPLQILRRARQDSEIGAVATDLERRLLNRGEPEVGARARFRFRRSMVRGKLAGWRYAMRLTLLPAEEDLQMIHLPKPLAPLYVALRPLRLLRKYRADRPEDRLPTG